jgi:hypothetical protein
MQAISTIWKSSKLVLVLSCTYHEIVAQWPLLFPLRTVLEISPRILELYYVASRVIYTIVQCFLFSPSHLFSFKIRIIIATELPKTFLKYENRVETSINKFFSKNEPTISNYCLHRDPTPHLSNNEVSRFYTCGNCAVSLERSAEAQHFSTLISNTREV